MASSKVMSTSTNSDLVRQSSTYSLTTIGDLQTDSKNFGSMSMDDLIRNMYGDNPPSSSDIIQTPNNTDAVIDVDGEDGKRLPVANKTVDEVWKEISGVDRKITDEEITSGMTLEEYLTKHGAVTEEDMKIGPVHGFVVDPPLQLDTRYPHQQGEGSGSASGAGAGAGAGAILWLGNGGDRAAGGRGKRRAVLEPVDKVSQQRQRRMIKNRESAARSRERKQAYTIELETLVTQLEEENAQLRQEKAERKRERIKQLMDTLIPVEEGRKPHNRQVLRRAYSAKW